MKEIGICVRYITDNYGSMLQLFALQKAVEKLNLKYEFIVYDKKTPGFLLKNMTRVFNIYFMQGKMLQIKKKYKMKKYPEIFKNNQKRLESFADFRKRHFHRFSERLKGFKALQEGAKKYDVVMVGSDQLWGPEGLDTNFFNLMFVPDNIRKVAYSASFGVKEIPARLQSKYKRFLERIEYISVREQTGQKIVKDVIGKKVPVVVDPVMLLSKEEWDNSISASKVVEEPYMLCYFLGASSKHRKAALELQAKTGWKIVTLPHIDEVVEADMNFGDIQLYNTTPEQFLNLIRNAEYICTDSFHGTAFSIINEKNFTVFNRFDDTAKYSRNSRIDTICNIFGLSDRRFSGNINDSFGKDIAYDNVREILKQLREKSWDFLSNSLS